ncbi:MAG: putative bifunctional diguanylate cyclase/phosphodiesterase [Acidiferrobacterales bacterium]
MPVSLNTLPSRRAFFERVQAVIHERAGANTPLAVLILDLDGFRDINNTLGHDGGDLLLEQVAERLQGMLRESDVLARIGDDEFGLLLPAVLNLGHAVLAASKIQKVMENSFLGDAQAVNVRASVGIVLYPEHGTDVRPLMRRADTALAMAKRSGSGFAIYDKEDTKTNLARSSLEADLRQAIGEGELVLYYQPKVNLKTAQISGMEALVRWDSSTRGFLPPDEFIPLAEQSSLIQPLTLWVLNAALRQCASYTSGRMKLNVAINLSPRNLDDPELPELVLRALQTWNVAPECLVLEITENAVMQNPTRCLESLNALSSIGLSLSIDDFGTGYSSLTYLRELPVHELKIDKSFVMNMTENPSNAMIVRSVIDLARNFNLKVVAEGVESQQAWNMLAHLDCDYAQGYYLSRPIPVAELDKWMTKSPWRLRTKDVEEQ